MKLWAQDSFSANPPASFRKRAGQNQPVDKMSPEFMWIATLPIAAGIFRQTHRAAEHIVSNMLFEIWLADAGHEPGLDLAALALRIEAMIADNRDTHFECWRSPDPVSRRELEISIARFGAARDMFMLSLVDRTAEAASRVNQRREMLTDSLTGFPNRSGFEEDVEQAIEESSKSEGSSSGRYGILVIDLSRFSRVNESVGALAGDELIITVARRLKGRIRASEILSRLGGNEFALFVTLDDTADPIGHIADRLADAFSEPCQLSNLEIQVECAFAAAIGNIGSDDPSETLRYAQVALKRAKVSKRFELYSPGSIASAQHRFSIETDLRRAIQRDELQLYYQPLIDLKTGTVSGFEALARWDHPDLGFISPVDFIPVAEECGLIVPLGRWALAEAARTIKDWDSHSLNQLPVKISVNMSAVQMLRDNVTQAAAEAINGAGIAGNQLTIELTESAFIGDPDGAKKILESLKALDVNLAMDDFGTGYSNLGYLQKLPIDVLKIDRSFIADMSVNTDKRAIVRTVLSLARALGMQTTAEGIECAEISDDLRSLGCSNGQGYYYARPLTKDAAYAFLAANRASPTI